MVDDEGSVDGFSLAADVDSCNLSIAISPGVKMRTFSFRRTPLKADRVKHFLLVTGVRIVYSNA